MDPGTRRQDASPSTTSCTGSQRQRRPEGAATSNNAPSWNYGTTPSWPGRRTTRLPGRMSPGPLRGQLQCRIQHESTSFSLALLLATERLKVIAAVHPGLWQPAVLAKPGYHRRPPLRRPLRSQRRLQLVQDSSPIWEPWLNDSALPAQCRDSSRCCARSGPGTTWISAATSTHIHDFTLGQAAPPARALPGAAIPPPPPAATDGRCADWYFSTARTSTASRSQIVEGARTRAKRRSGW